MPSYLVDGEKRIDEVARFDRALVATRQQITKIKNEVEKNIGPEEALIFDAHLMVLEDQALIGETIREFETSGRNIETCFNQSSSRYIKAFSEIDDAYLRERAGGYSRRRAARAAESSRPGRERAQPARPKNASSSRTIFRRRIRRASIAARRSRS